MTNNKTTELIEIHLNNALSMLNLNRKDIAELKGGETISCNISTQRQIGWQIERALEALPAFEQPAVREMNVQEFIDFLRPVVRETHHMFCPYEAAAKALAKLGTIRIVSDEIA